MRNDRLRKVGASAACGRSGWGRGFRCCVALLLLTLLIALLIRRCIMICQPIVLP
ncbi:MAG: hypothetical protein ACKESB_03475 [Candidatus Hodgkinia cicadicola]